MHDPPRTVTDSLLTTKTPKKKTKVRNQSPKNKTKKKKQYPKRKHHLLHPHATTKSRTILRKRIRSIRESGFEAFVIGFFARSDQILHPQYPKKKKVFQRDRLRKPRTRRRKEKSRPSPFFLTLNSLITCLQAVLSV